MPTETRPAQLTPAQAADRTEAVLLDVREADEVAEGRIAASTHIPLGQLAARTFGLDRNRRVITVCRSGGRSPRPRSSSPPRATTSPTSPAA